MVIKRSPRVFPLDHLRQLGVKVIRTFVNYQNCRHGRISHFKRQLDRLAARYGRVSIDDRGSVNLVRNAP